MIFSAICCCRGSSDMSRRQVKSLNLRVIPSQSPSPAMLRENRCDLLITPLPPSGMDIVQKRLLSDHYVCYFDPKARTAPAGRSAYLAARHITVVYTDNERLDFDRRLAANGFLRDIAISVPSFSGVPSFLRGSQMLASMPSLLASGVMRGFAHARIPLASRTKTLAELPMFMVWHQRYQKDPAHRWIRAPARRPWRQRRPETEPRLRFQGSLPFAKPTGCARAATLELSHDSDRYCAAGLQPHLEARPDHPQPARYRFLQAVDAADDLGAIPKVSRRPSR